MTVHIPTLDIEVTPLTSTDVVRLVRGRPGGPALLLNHNLHSAYLHNRYSWFRDFYSRASIIVVDGWPILQLTKWAARARLNSNHRIGSTDWMDALVKETASSADPMRIFLLGGSAETNAKARQKLTEKAATIVSAGHHGYLDAASEERVIADIVDFDPDLVLVGMGMPLQERFLDRNLSKLPPAHYATVGGAIDYIAQDQKLAPRALGSVGLEWLWRFLHDPGRLWRRYLLEPLLLVPIVARNWASSKRRSFKR